MRWQGRTRLVVAKHEGNVDGQRATPEADGDEAEQVLLSDEHDDIHLQPRRLLMHTRDWQWLSFTIQVWSCSG